MTLYLLCYREEEGKGNAKKEWYLYQKLYPWLLLNRREISKGKLLAEYIVTQTKIGVLLLRNKGRICMT